MTRPLRTTDAAATVVILGAKVDIEVVVGNTRDDRRTQAQEIIGPQIRRIDLISQIVSFQLQQRRGDVVLPEGLGKGFGNFFCIPRDRGIDDQRFVFAAHVAHPFLSVDSFGFLTILLYGFFRSATSEKN